MPCVESTIKTQRIMCLKKFIENYHSPWKLILSHHLKNFGDKFLLHCNYDVTDLPKSLPKFYRECLEAWATLTEKQPTLRDYVIEQILWNNKHICIDDKPQFFKDMFLTNGKLKPWNFFFRKRPQFKQLSLDIRTFKSTPGIMEGFVEFRNYMLLSNPRFVLYGFHRTNFPLKVW